MRYLKLTLEYDGSEFSGWQKQTGSGLRTVQGVLEEALLKLTGERIATCGAGRTDAGVHALGQVVSFATKATIPASRFPAALNGLLPPDVVVKGCEEVDASFHARYSAVAKEYRYLIWNERLPSALWRRYSHHVSLPLDEVAMQEAARYLQGRHDFIAFSAAGSSAKTTVRNVISFKVTRHGRWVVMEVVADGFLYKMVRLMAGTLVAVGIGKYKPQDVLEILESRARGRGGPALPPQGLYLVRIYYSGEEIARANEESTPLLPPWLPEAS
ncbi:MAG: tRNA pseudouridine(38-40) synthase TruA [Thermacetogeniaceae bacterium]